MPVHLPAQNRRQFLVTVSAGLVACSSDAFGRDVEGDLVYLLNDTHIGEKHPPGSPVPSHLRLASQRQRRSPSAAANRSCSR